MDIKFVYLNPWIEWNFDDLAELKYGSYLTMPALGLETKLYILQVGHSVKDYFIGTWGFCYFYN